MATENRQLETTFVAGEDLRTHQYKAIALVDGKKADNADEASGILISKPNDTEFGTIVYNGEAKAYAGGAISAGDRLTISAGGLITSATSGDSVVGEAKGTATGSGSIVTGLFSFAAVAPRVQNFTTPITSAGATLLAGIAVALDDESPANNAEEFAGAAQAAVTSGTAGTLVVCGITNVVMADTTSRGDGLTIATSGYFSIGDSGDNIIGRCITNTASGVAGSAFIAGKPGYLFT